MSETNRKARDAALRMAAHALRGYVEAMGKWMTGAVTRQACLDLADELEARVKTVAGEEGK